MSSVSSMSSLIPQEAQQLILDSTSKAPNRALLEVEPTLRNISPLFLRETPYQPDDSFLDKCLKTISAVLGLIHYARPEVRSLVEIHPLASQVQALIQPKIGAIEEEMCQIHLSLLDTHFSFEYYAEKLKVVKGIKLEVRRDELVDRFCSAFKEELGARQVIYLDGKKIPIQDKATQQALLEERKTHLIELFDQLEKVSGNTLEQVQMGADVFKGLYEHQYALVIALNYAWVGIRDALESPLRTLS